MNPKADCAASDRWDMAGGAPFAAQPTASFAADDDTLGTVSLDVTSDILSGSAQHGWIIMKEDENRQGSVGIGSRESASGAVLKIKYRVN